MIHTVAYISLWLPKPSETFILREILCLREGGLAVLPAALYGPVRRHLSREMQAFTPQVSRLGLRHLRRGLADEAYWRRRDPAAVRDCVRLLLAKGYRTLERTGENAWAWHAGFTLARQFEAARVTHIHAPWATGPAMAAMVAGRLAGIPFSFAARAGDIYPPEPALGEKMARASFVRVNTASNVDYLRALASRLPASAPVDPAKVTLVYNAVTLAPAQEAPVAMGPTRRILAIGRFVKTKGFDDLLRACAVLAGQGMDFILTLAGAGAEGNNLKQVARSLGLGDRVLFPGFVTHEQVSRLLHEADCFVMPSVVGKNGDRDGIPNVIMEAAMHRVPVVATDCSGIGEVIRDGETGWLVPQRQPQALAQALAETLTRRDLALPRAQACKALVTRLFDQEANCKTLRGLYETHSRRWD